MFYLRMDESISAAKWAFHKVRVMGYLQSNETVKGSSSRIPDPVISITYVVLLLGSLIALLEGSGHSVDNVAIALFAL